MDDAVKQRMKWALEELSRRRGEDPRGYSFDVSINAGLNRGYLWESFNRQKGSLNGYKKIAGMLGISFAWLAEEIGQPFIGDAPSPLDRELVLIALEAIFEHFMGFAEDRARGAALPVLDVVEHPPDGRSGTDMHGRVRNAVLGQLRVYGRP